MQSSEEVIRAEALFVSRLQASQQPAPEEIRDAISETLRQLGEGGCAAAVAEEFGEHPEVAVIRMNWALSMVHGVLVAA